PRFRPWWLLLLLPLLLLPLTCNRQRTPEPRADTLFGMEVDTDSFLIIVDKSKSMTPHFDRMRDEARRLLNERLKKTGQRPTFANVIAYDKEATSALGEIAPLNEANAARLRDFLDRLEPKGGTKLAAAMEKATDEIKKHGRKTTLLILTDA